ADGAVDGLQIDPLGTEMPLAVRDNADGAIVSYARIESGEYNLYAQHMLNSPYLRTDPAWPATGLALCTHSGNQSVGTIVRDGSGGAIAVWADSRDSATTGVDLFAQRALSTGTLPTNGTSVPGEAHAGMLVHMDPSPLRAEADLRFSLPARSR